MSCPLSTPNFYQAKRPRARRRARRSRRASLLLIGSLAGVGCIVVIYSTLYSISYFCIRSRDIRANILQSYEFRVLNSNFFHGRVTDESDDHFMRLWMCKEMDGSTDGRCRPVCGMLLAGRHQGKPPRLVEKRIQTGFRTGGTFLTHHSSIKSRKMPLLHTPTIWMA